MLRSSSISSGSLEKSLDQCLQCQDTMSLYRQALKMTLNSLSTDRERHVMREVTNTRPHRNSRKHSGCDPLCEFSSLLEDEYALFLFSSPQILCLVCASHNGVSESEVLDLLPEVELPVLSSLLHCLNRLCIVTLRCGLIRFQHLQVIKLMEHRVIRKQGASPNSDIYVTEHL